MRKPEFISLLCRFFLCALALQFCGSLRADSIQNPYWDDAGANFKLWFDDPYPLPALKSNSRHPIELPDTSNMLQPVDPDPTEAEAGQFIKYVSYESVEPLDRVYAGFSHDFFGGADGGHEFLREPWGAAGPNVVPEIDSAMIEEVMGDMAAISDSIRKIYGINWANASVANAGPGSTLDPNTADEYDRFFYYNNTLFTTPTAGAGPFTAMMPNYLMLDGASFHPQDAFMRLIVTAGYMPIETRRELLRNGLFATAVQAAWRQAMPFKADPFHPLRHRSHYTAQGDDSGNYRHSVGLENSFFRHQQLTHNYDPNLLSRNLVESFKSMSVAPPVATLELLENTGSVDNNSSRSSVRLWHLAGQTATARVSLGGSFDMQGLPLDYQWTVVRGNKNATIEHLGGDEWLITVPYDPNLPGGIPDGPQRSENVGRTDILLTADNGHQISAPAVVSFMIWDTSLDDWRHVWDPYVPDNTYHPGRENYYRVTQPTGLAEAKILPGETLEYELYSDDPNHFPISMTQWEGAGGELDGNVWTFTPAADAEERSHNLAVTAHTDSFEDTNHGAKTVVEVSHIVSRPTADVVRGPAPLIVNFDGAASADKDGAITAYAWDFDDGNSSAQSAPSHTFTDPGFYDVKLTVTGPSGTDATTLRIEVEPDWNLLIDNGWDANAVDDTVWTLTPPPDRIDNNAEWQSGGWKAYYPTLELDDPSEMVATASLTAPLFLEMQFNTWQSRDANLDILGHRITTSGTFEEKGVEHGMELAFQAGSSTGFADPVYLGSHDSRGLGSLLLRVFVQPDPVHPGKLRLRGSIRTTSGIHEFAFDDLEAGLSNQLKFESFSGLSRSKLHRVRLRSADAPGLNAPSISAIGESGTNIYPVYLNSSEEKLLENSLPADQDFGFPETIGGFTEKTYTVRNDGDGDLVFDSPPIRIEDSSAFTITQQPTVSTLSPGQSATFTVRYTPSNAQGQDIGMILISGTDPLSVHHRFWIKGRARTPNDILIRGNHSNIAAGATTARNQDFTDFGPATMGESVTHRFFLFNNGHDPLNISDVSLTGSSDFSLSRAPRSVIGANGSAIFEVTFTPSTTGARNATVTVQSDDADTPNYSFALSGEGLPDPGPAVAEVRGNGQIINDGDTTPDTADHTDFGSTAVWDRGQILRSFWVGATGGDMDITGVTLSGPDADRFAVIGPPPAYAKAGTAVPFHILFDPVSAGTHSATVTVGTSDPANPQIVFDIEAEALGQGVMAVEGGGDDIKNGSTRAYTYDDTYYGFHSIGDNHTHTFRVFNIGDLASLTGVTATLAGPNADQFTITDAPNSTLNPGSYSEIDIRFNPNSGGTKDAIVTLSSDGVPDFTFTITGSSQFLEEDTTLDLPNINQGKMAWGDFDNDGDQDFGYIGALFDETIGTNGRYDYRAGIFMNNAGVFEDLEAGLPPGQHRCFETADFDGNGYLDIIYAGWVFPEDDDEEGTPLLRVYLNDGGAFTSHQILDHLKLIPSTMLCVDYDGDGDLDLATVAWDDIAGERGLIFLRNNQGTLERVDGILPAEKNQKHGMSQDSLAAGDLNRDGWIDFVNFGELYEGAQPYPARGHLYINKGADRGFEVSEIDATGSGEVRLVDFNLDGWLDIAVSSGRTQQGWTIPDYPESYFIHVNDGTGRSFTEEAYIGTENRNILEMDWADYNADGTADMVTYMPHISGTSGSTSVSIAELYRNVDGQLLVDDSLNIKPQSRGDLLWIDLEFDGGLDIVSMGTYDPTDNDSNGFYVYKNIDTSSRSTPPDAPANLMVQDENGVSVLTWASANDPETPTANMTYNVRIGSAPGQDDIRPAQADLVTGRRRLSASGDFLGGVLDPDSGEFVGNIARFKLPPGDYYAAVQGIDGAFVGGAWSQEVAFTVTEPTNQITDDDEDGLDDDWETNTFGSKDTYNEEARPFERSIIMDYAMDLDGTFAPGPQAGVTGPSVHEDEEGDEWLELRYRRSTTAHNVSWSFWLSTDGLQGWDPIVFDDINFIHEVEVPDPDGDGSAETCLIRIRMNGETNQYLYLRMVPQVP